MFVIRSSAKCLRVSKTESYCISRICFEMTRQATMPSSSEKCLRVSKTESYTLSRICFAMTRQATMPSSKAWLCLADERQSQLARRHMQQCFGVSKTDPYSAYDLFWNNEGPKVHTANWVEVDMLDEHPICWDYTSKTQQHCTIKDGRDPCLAH
jgi:hypothetical protein